MTVTFHARATLGLGAPVLTRLSLRSATDSGPAAEGLTIHHVGDGGSLYRPNEIDRLRAIWGYHVNTLGYGDIAYHGAYDADGNVYELRGGQYVGAHAKSTNNEANRLTDGVCFLEDARGITAGALAGFEWWANLWHWVHGRPAVMYAHRWWAEAHGGTPTACPGDDWDRVVRFVGGKW